MRLACRCRRYMHVAIAFARVHARAGGFRRDRSGMWRIGVNASRARTARPMDWMGLSTEEWTAVRLSLKVATVATIVALPFGIAIALALARGRFWGQSLLNGLVHLPLIMPPVVTGYLLLIVLGQRGLIGGFLATHLGIVFSFR